MKFKFHGMNNVDDPADVGARFNAAQQKSYSECVNILNMDADESGVSLRQGQTVALAGACHSGWSNGTVAYAVKSGYLVQFTGTATTNLIAVNGLLPMSFCKVNDLTVATNGQQYLVIENGVATEAIAPTGRFKVTPPAGQYLTFYSGRVYIASGATLICTEPYSVDSCDSRQMFTPITDDPITGLAAVDNGIFIGTTKETFFLAGADPFSEGGMALKTITNYGTVHRTMLETFSDKVSLAQMSGRCAMWQSTRGFCAGGNSGSFVNISEKSAALPVVATGASMLREQDGNIHFVSVTGTGTAYNTYIPPTLDVTEIEL